MQNIEGKVAVITGTSNPRGIGVAIARTFAEEGAHVVLADVNGAAAAERAAELRDTGLQASSRAVDMGDNASVRALADWTYGEHGGTDVLVLNHVAPTGGAGHGLLSPDVDSWELHTQVNLLGAVYGIKAFVPRMIEAGKHAHVMATTSGAGATGTMYGNGPYATTKAALGRLFECLYGQLRDAGADIVASLIFPGVTNTFPTDELGQMTVDLLNSTGLKAALMQPSEVARYALDAIHEDSFWARTRDDDPVHSAAVRWEAEMHRAQAEANIARTQPDSFLWGPRSDQLGP